MSKPATPWYTLGRRPLNEIAVKIAVIFALDSEFAPWRRIRPFRRLRSESGAYETVIGSARIHVVLSGAGPAHAARVARRVLAARPDLCISTGLAGALRSSFVPGQILAASRVLSSESTLVGESHPLLLEAALSSGARPAAAFLTASSILGSAEEKQRFAPVADAVEMESFAVLSEAAKWHIPAVAVRAISDAADANLPLDFNRVLDAHGHVRLSLIFSELARRPHKIPALVRFGRTSRRAAVNLARFLDAYVLALSAQPELLRSLTPAEVA